MPDITTLLPLEALEPFFDTKRSKDPKKTFDSEANDRYWANLRKIVYPALVEFLKQLKAEGRLQPIPNSEGYLVPNFTIWNGAANLDLATATPEMANSVLEKLAERLGHSLVFPITYPFDKLWEAGDEAGALALDRSIAYNEVMLGFNAGKLQPFTFSHENCSRTGLPLLLAVKDWVARGGVIKDGDIVPLKPAEPEVLQETRVTLKTGNFLVADWFRIEAFTELMQEKHFSINSDKGKNDHTRYLAETFGVLNFTNYFSPSIFQKGDTVVGGYFNEDEEKPPAGYTRTGDVCTDLWAATFVEYETLVELVSRKHPEDGKAIVDDYIKKHSGALGIHQITVQPGEYFLYYYGDNDNFSKMAKAAKLKLDTGKLSPRFVFSRERLLPASS